MPWAALSLLLEALAYCRAGGGGDYSSGGSFSSGHSYSGGASYSGGYSHHRHHHGDFLFDLLTAYARWAEAHPLIGVPLTLAIVYGAFRLLTAGNSRYVSATIERGLAAQADGRLEEGLSRLRERDPGFRAEEFLSWAKAAFFKVQQA
ncbi:MAG: hypothetical protein PHU21_11770, partial [Elusimicrobia bacterium]|nr:hypothetical protein [Elusimicrobiota bacterium]